MDGWVGGWVGGRMDEWMEEWIEEWTDGWKKGWMEEWMYGWMEEWMDGWQVHFSTLNKHFIRVTKSYLPQRECNRFGRTNGQEFPHSVAQQQPATQTYKNIDNVINCDSEHIPT